MRKFQFECGGQTTGAEGAIVLDVQGEAKNVNLRVDYITRSMLGNVPELLADLLEIAAYVFCADQRASRGSDKLTNYGRDWRRDMEFHIPVRCPDVWSDVQIQQELCSTLGFLSDDAYTFEFTLAENPAEIQEQYFPNLIDAAPTMDEVALFSGGIDSFAGAVNDIVQNNKSLLLVGHSGATKIRSVQDKLISELKKRGYQRQVSFVPVSVSNIKARTVEHTQRTRSFLFACLGLHRGRLRRLDQWYLCRVSRYRGTMAGRGSAQICYGLLGADRLDRRCDMRLMNTAHYQAARTQLDNAGGGGPWADPFDDPTGTVLWSRWINGSTSGTAKENCALWSNKQGFSGSSSACEWRTNSGAGRANVELLNWETLAAGPLIVRMRCKVETYALPKVWLLFNTVFADPLWEMYVDVTPDGTAAADRVGYATREMTYRIIR